MGEAALTRIRRLHERLREIYRQPDSPLHNPARAERHQQYLVTLETERKSAQVLTELMSSASDKLRACGFVGPVAGIGLLTGIGRLSGIQQFLIQQVPLENTDTAYPDTAATAMERLRQCLSPFSPMYTMHDLGWADEAEVYCRHFAASRRRRHSTEVISPTRGSHALRHCVWCLRTIWYWNSLPR